MAKHLVIGGDGLVGRCLTQALLRTGEEVWWTSRRPEGDGPGRLALDLAAEPGEWPRLPEADCAYLLAAVTSVARCRQQPEACRVVNVERVLELARRLAGQGAFLLLLSSSLVFSGRRPLPEPEDPMDPPTEYGRHKAAVEEGLLSLGRPAAVLRVTKVVWPQMPLLRGWRGELEAGRAIHPFHDMVMAPVGLELAAGALLELARTRRAGRWHLSARRDISYAEAARHLARGLGADPGLVRSVSRESAGLSVDEAPPATALGMVSTGQALGWRPPEPEEALDLVLGGA